MRNCTIRVAKTKALISFALTAPLFSPMQIVGFPMLRFIFVVSLSGVVAYGARGSEVCYCVVSLYKTPEAP